MLILKQVMIANTVAMENNFMKLFYWSFMKLFLSAIKEKIPVFRD